MNTPEWMAELERLVDEHGKWRWETGANEAAHDRRNARQSDKNAVQARAALLAHVRLRVQPAASPASDAGVPQGAEGQAVLIPAAVHRQLVEALEQAQRDVNSMKVEAETAALICDDDSVCEHCETISAEGLEADTRLRAALASLQSLQRAGGEPQGGWRPIETAPKNIYALLWVDVEVGAPLIVQGCWFEVCGCERGWIDTDGNVIQATHWMPLPAAPNAGGLPSHEGHSPILQLAGDRCPCERCAADRQANAGGLSEGGK
jgi:hypothetical protein